MEEEEEEHVSASTHGAGGCWCWSKVEFTPSSAFLQSSLAPSTLLLVP
jgi:hypothetical protein